MSHLGGKWVCKVDFKQKDEAITLYGDLSRPILTLDDIEAWLKQSYGKFPDYWSDERVSGHISAIDDLLIQVQAWREEMR